jgi:polysaccharide biosynthesis transport protein
MITRDEFRRMLRAVLHWWWIVVVAVGVAGGTAFYLTQQETLFYVARTSLMIGNTLASRLPDQNQLSIGSSLARYYGELARREPILKPVQDSLKLPFQWELVSDRMLMTNVVPSANLLEVYITDSNPERAAAIANSIGEQLIAYSPASPDKIHAEQQAVDQQLQESAAKIKEIQKTIDDLTAQQKQATSASDLAEINQKLTQFNDSLAQEQSSYKSLLNYKNNSVINSLSFFERATPPSEPLPSKRKVIVGGAGLAGLMLALLAIFALEHLDTRLRGGRDIEDHFNIDNLGNIPLGPPMLAAPVSFAAQRLSATRNAQTNIMLAGAERGTRTLMITSPEPSESRTAFSIDLADLFARSGHKVLIVDADTARSFLTGILAPDGAQHTVTALGRETTDIWSYLRPTPIPNVILLPGNQDGNGAPAMLPSLRWRELIQHLLDTADVIIFDGPSALSGPDAALLAPHVDGVVLALDPATNNREQVTKSKDRLLNQKGTHLLGAVTFTPTTERLGIGSVWRQLRGQKQLSLPPAGTSYTAAAQAAMPGHGAHRPIVTPAPSDVYRTDQGAHGPIITPMPVGEVVDASEVVLEQLPAPLALVPLPSAAARRPRKAAHTSRRRSDQHDDSAE